MASCLATLLWKLKTWLGEAWSLECWHERNRNQTPPWNELAAYDYQSDIVHWFSKFSMSIHRTLTGRFGVLLIRCLYRRAIFFPAELFRGPSDEPRVLPRSHHGLATVLPRSYHGFSHLSPTPTERARVTLSGFLCVRVVTNFELCPGGVSTALCLYLPWHVTFAPCRVEGRLTFVPLLQA